MADFYYLYDPADNLALGQAIHLANTDGGMSYIVPFAIKDGTVNLADAASVALQAINTAIAAGPLNNGGTSDPVSNRISAAAAQGLVGLPGWSAIKAMVKASINQAPPTGWSEASLEDGATTYSVISSKGYSELQQDVFTAGKWKDADTSVQGYRGNPYIAFGGQVLDAAFIDYSGHHVPTPGFIGEETVSNTGINTGQMYFKGNAVVQTDSGDPVYGLAINAPGKDVTLVNFSATSTGFGGSGGSRATDDLGFTRGDGSDRDKALGTALGIYQGNVILAGDLVVDQLCQVVAGTRMRVGAIEIVGKGADVTIDKARIFLGAVRGWETMFSVSSSATLLVNDSTIYGFSSSNSNTPLLPRQGLNWAAFSGTETGNDLHSNGLAHLLSVAEDGVVRIVNSSLLREDAWVPSGEYSLITDNLGGTRQFWYGNDYKNLANGDLYVGQYGTLEIDNSKILGTILTDQGSDSLTVIDSVVAGSSFGILSEVDGVRLEGGNVTLRNSLIDNLDVAVIGQASLKQETDTHILDTNTPKLVSVTTDSAYTALPTFAGPSSLQRLEGWADLDNAATGNKAVFQFQGPQTVLATPSNKTREIPVLLSQAALPKVGPNGAVTYSLTATFDEAVKGFDSSDLEKALGTSAVAAGWQVAVAPFTRDSGRSWNFQLQSPVNFSAPVSLQLATGAAQSTLVTFPSSLESSASNSISLVPVAGGGSGVTVAPKPTEVVEPVTPGTIGFASVDITRTGDTSSASSVRVSFEDGTATGAAAAPTEGNGKGLSSSSYPYVLPVTGSGVRTTAILTTGDAVGSYTMAGTPDGLGAFDNTDGTFTLLVNHELASTVGATRLHGGKGAFISAWTIDKASLAVQRGADLIRNVYGWNPASQASNAVANNSTNGNGISFSRFCSADLPSPTAFFNAATGLGTQARIFLNGEEGGATGYALANIASGSSAGDSFVLGKFNLSTNGSGLTGVGGWENLVANPKAQDKTVVIGNNDGGTGIMSNALVVYQGTKTASGTDADKAGLTNGTIKFVVVNGISAEISNTTTRATAITSGTRFSLNATASTTFSRPEDGAWDPNNPNRYYFVTTDRLDTFSDGIGSQVGQTRLWRLTFDDITNPDLGGSIDLVIDGDIVNGKKVNMFDNISIDHHGHILLQEDVGNAAHNGKIWQYDTASDRLKLLTEFDAGRFGDIGVPATLPFTIDEESSGIIDVQDILGAGWFLLDAQAHYPNPNADLVEGGQILALFNPDTYNKAVDYINTPQTLSFAPGETVKSVLVPILGDAKPEFQESFNIKIAPAPASAGSFVASSAQVLINDKTYLPGPINFNYLIGEGGVVNLDIDFLQGRLYGSELLPSSGDFRLSPTSGGFSAELSPKSTSRDYIQLNYVPGAAAQTVVQSELVLNERGVYETIANAGRGLLPAVVHNYLHTAGGDDRIIGSAGTDFIRAGAGDDWVDAGAGDDIVRPGSGNDQIRLGAGFDTLLMTRDQQIGTAVLLDFSPEDRLVIADGLKTLSGIGTASLKVGDGSGSFKELLLTGASLSSWDQRMIQFA